MYCTSHLRAYQLVATSCFCISKKIPEFLQKTELSVPTGIASVVSVEAQREDLIRAGNISDTSEKREALSREDRDPCI